jgi:hypothetical protein
MMVLPADVLVRLLGVLDCLHQLGQEKHIILLLCLLSLLFQKLGRDPLVDAERSCAIHLLDSLLNLLLVPKNSVDESAFWLYEAFGEGQDAAEAGHSFKDFFGLDAV